MLMVSHSIVLYAVSLLVIRILMRCFLGVYYRVFLGSLMMLAYARGLLVLLTYFVCLCSNQVVGVNVYWFGFWGVLRRSYGFISALPFMSHKVSGAMPTNLMLLSSGNKMLLVGIGLILLLAMVCVIKVVSNSRGPMRV